MKNATTFIYGCFFLGVAVFFPLRTILQRFSLLSGGRRFAIGRFAR